MIDLLSEEFKPSKSSQIKYCKPVVWSGVLSGKYETIRTNDQIIFGDENLKPRKQRKKADLSGEDLQEPTMLNSSESIENSWYNSLQYTLHQFKSGLQIFRSGYKKSKIMGRNRLKLLYLADMMRIEEERGKLTIQDIREVFGISFSNEDAERYLEVFIGRGYLIKVESAARYNVQSRSPFFLVTALGRSLLHRVWALGLGERLKHSMYLSPDMVRALVNECGMNYREFSEFTGVKEQMIKLTCLGVKNLSHDNRMKIYDKLYYLLPVTFWPEQIKQEWKEGKRPRWGNAEHKAVIAKAKGYINILKNGYDQALIFQERNKARKQMKEQQEAEQEPE